MAKANVTLSLDAHEAAMLVGLCRRVGGSPQGPRGVFDRIKNELLNAGVSDIYFGNTNENDHITFDGTVYVEDRLSLLMALCTSKINQNKP